MNHIEGGDSDLLNDGTTFYASGSKIVFFNLCFFLPFTQNFFKLSKSENSLPLKTSCCGCPYEQKNNRKLVLLPQIALWNIDLKIAYAWEGQKF